MTDASKAPAGAPSASQRSSIGTKWAVLAGVGGILIGGGAVVFLCGVLMLASKPIREVP